MINTNRYAALALLATLAACGTKDDAPAAGGAAPNSIAIPTSKAGSDDADLKEINSYRLTMDDVRKFAAIKAKGVDTVACMAVSTRGSQPSACSMRS